MITISAEFELGTIADDTHTAKEERKEIRKIACGLSSSLCLASLACCEHIYMPLLLFESGRHFRVYSNVYTPDGSNYTINFNHRDTLIN